MAAYAHLSFPSPIGPLTLFAEDDQVIVLEAGRAPSDGRATPLLQEARRQLDEYFDGNRTEFQLPLNPDGTARRREIWGAMTAIPYGETWTYGELATVIQSSPRAVGGACAGNPLPIFIPCHRVLNSGGALGNYSFADGAETKHQLLRLEGAML